MTDGRDSGSSGGGASGDAGDTQPVPVSQTLRPDQTLRVEAGALESFKQRLSKQGSLVVIAGTPADVGNHLVVDGAVVIGREAGDLPLRDGRISRQHASVTLEGGDYLVRDLGSTNGTRVNGQPVEGQRALDEGDQILVGQTVIKFTLVDRTEALYLKQMERLVGTDELTGLLAKHRFDAALKEAIRVARLTRRSLSVMMMDMDGLKSINDRHGHHVGAGTIRQVGALIARVLARRGEACRFGGDEFSVFMAGTSLSAARAAAEQIRQEVEDTDFVVGGSPPVKATISIGVAELPPDVDAAESLLDLADQALYRAKALGRNVVSD